MPGRPGPDDQAGIVTLLFHTTLPFHVTVTFSHVLAVIDTFPDTTPHARVTPHTDLHVSPDICRLPGAFSLRYLLLPTLHGGYPHLRLTCSDCPSIYGGRNLRVPGFTGGWSDLRSLPTLPADSRILYTTITVPFTFPFTQHVPHMLRFCSNGFAGGSFWVHRTRCAVRWLDRRHRFTVLPAGYATRFPHDSLPVPQFSLFLLGSPTGSGISFCGSGSHLRIPRYFTHTFTHAPLRVLTATFYWFWIDTSLHG